MELWTLADQAEQIKFSFSRTSVLSMSVVVASHKVDAKMPETISVQLKSVLAICLDPYGSHNLCHYSATHDWLSLCLRQVISLD